MTPNFREQALREMGLSPVWVRRAEPPLESTDAARLAVVPTVVPASRVGVEAPFHPTPIAHMPWAELADAVAQCTACPLGLTRRQAVFGAGLQDAPWMLVGEAPGEEEDAHGMPFVGPSGHLLDNMLRAAGLSREHEIYITNTVKCRPPASRRPELAEVHQCVPYLQRQIALIRPRLILALGAVAAQSLLATDEAVGSLRGRVHVRRFGDQEIPVIVTFHPAYVLRKLSEKASSWADLCLATETMRNATVAAS